METNKQFKSTGKWMLTLTWVILLVGLTYVFGVFEENKFNPNRNPDGVVTSNFREVVLQRNAYNHYVSNGKINGVDVVFMLDTGATDVAVPAQLAQKLSLKPGAPMIVSTANGRAQVRATRIDFLQLGPIELENIRAAISPGMGGEEILLGMSVLKQLDFSQSGDQLTLRQYYD